MKKKNYLAILYYLSVFIIMIGVIQLIPLIIIPFYKEEITYAPCFIIPGVLSIFAGYLINFFLKDKSVDRLSKNYDSILVVLIWLMAILISTIPWMMTGNYNFTQAMFEMTSGFSTTGLSVVDVDTCPKIFLFFRSIVLFVGGVGFVLILTSTLSEKYNLNIYNAEGHTDRLLPNLKNSAKLILSIYSFYIIVGVIAYLLAGMSIFDAINTAIAALSTGGFSVNGESIYGYHSLAVEIITIILMMLGQTNFVIHYAILKRKFNQVYNNCETKFFVIILVVVMTIMVGSLLSSGYCSNLGDAIRVGAFNFVTCITTTGFISVKSLSMLPTAVFNIMTFCMLIGGNMESTAGGIKQYRVIIALKGVYYAIKDTVKNDNVVRTKFVSRFGKKNVLTDQEISSTTTYIFLYIILFFIGSYIFSCYGYNLQDSMFEFSSALSTVGLSVGITNYNASGIVLWTAIIGMFFGRLEIMVIFQAFIRIFKDIKGKEY